MIAFEHGDVLSLERRLRDRRGELLKEVRDVSGRDEDEPFRKLAGEVADQGDESVATTLIDTNHAAVNRDLSEVRAIDRTLERIAAGSYGRCIACADDIPAERLRANPTAERCFPCQDDFEKTHNHDNWPHL